MGVLKNETRCVVTDYEPGLVINHNQFGINVRDDDLTWLNSGHDNQTSSEEILSKANEILTRYGLVYETSDFESGIIAFSGSQDLYASIDQIIENLNLSDAPVFFDEKVKRLLTESLRNQVPLKCITKSHEPKCPTKLQENATHFGYVISGKAELSGIPGALGRSYNLYPNTYFCVPGEATVSGDAAIQFFSRLDLLGQFFIGGAIEPWGRLKYIDGCTDTLLIPPASFGGPCLNALYFPANTRQTAHTHSSVRMGLVLKGQGICRTPNGDLDLSPGQIFLLPPWSSHAFHTGNDTETDRAALSVLAFHPDSDYGPTDEEHPMLNRTYYKFSQRLKSLRRTASKPV